MIKKKPNGYWKNEENVIAEARRIMEEHGWSILPSSTQLRKQGYNSLNFAITKYHGGTPSFRATLGQTNTRKTNGYWESLDNTLAEARKAMEEQGWDALPSHGDLTKHGYASLSYAISKYRGKIQTFRTTLGQTNSRKPKGYWESLDNTIKEAQQAMQKHKWDTLPSSEHLHKHGYHSLNHAINRYHGKIEKFRILLTEHETGKTTKQQLEELLDEYIAA